MESRLLAFPCSVTASSRPLINPDFSAAQNPNFLAPVRCFCTRYSRRSSDGGGGQYWDSNAESLRTERFKFRFEEESLNDDDDEEYDDIGFRRRGKQQRNWWSDNSSSEMDEGSGVFEEAIDTIWFFKVVKAFGWMVPAIILSTVLATGPNAFLMALVLPLGQSMLSLAIEKVWGRMGDSQKPRSRNKKKPFARTTSHVEMSGEEKQEQSSSATKERWGYQSWVAADDCSVKKGGQHVPGFGGWDELDRRGESEKGPTRKPPRTTGGPPRPLVEKKGKFSRRGKNRDTPLLIRLLIAVFPFLGSWTRIL